jgi:hypothetical protein
MLVFGSCAHAGDAEEDKVRVYPMSRVNAIAITSSARRIENRDGAMDCALFPLTERSVRFFLRHAKPVSHYTYFHGLDWSECEGEARVTFANGDVATLTIEVGDRGVLSPLAGRHAGRVFYFSCEACDETNFGTKRPPKGAR